LRFALRGLTAAGTLGDVFDLRAHAQPWLSAAHLHTRTNPAPRLDAYIADYLTRESAAEGLVRNLPVCAYFLQATALRDGKTNNRVREGGVTGHTVDHPESSEGAVHLARRTPADAAPDCRFTGTPDGIDIPSAPDCVAQFRQEP